MFESESGSTIVLRNVAVRRRNIRRVRYALDTLLDDFAIVELEKRGKTPQDSNLDEMDALWNAAKDFEKHLG